MIPRVRFMATLALLAVATAAGAYSGGISGRSQIGCGVAGCHGSNDSAVVTIDAIPAGAGFDLTVTVEEDPGDPVQNEPQAPLNRGGFNLSASFGALTPDVPAEVQNYGDGEVSHTTAGNDQRSWDLRWEPKGTGLCSLDLFAAGNAVNGNGIADPGDRWGLVSQTLTIDASEDAEDPTGEIVHPASDGLYFAGGRIGNSPIPTVIGSINLAIAADDDVGIQKVEVFDTDVLGQVSLGEASFDPGSGLFTLLWTTTGSEPPGLHTLTFRVTDCAGNVVDVSREVLVL